MMKHNASAIKVLLYAYSTSMFSLGIMTPLYAFFVQDLGGGIVETAWSMALFSMVTGVVTILLYKKSWSERFRKEFLVGGWFLWLLSLLMYCVMTSIAMLFVSQLLGGFGSALSSSAFDAEYAESAGNQQLKAWGLFEGVISITSGLASIVAGLVVNYFGLHFLMVCMAIAATISFMFIFYYSYIRKELPMNGEF